MNEQNPTEQTIGGDPAEDATSSYDIDAIQDKWQKIWTDLDPFKVRDDDSAERRYLLDMYPYPSGDLHMGHAEAWALADVIARWWFQQGYDVLHPVGWDSFGLPAENAAIKRGENPALWTDANIATQAESFRHYAISFDWSTRVETHDPGYYKWTQWLFLKLYEHDLAYRKNSPVNWCPNDQTVLANEQVIAGHCERCGAEVTKRNLNQWYFRITAVQPAAAGRHGRAGGQVARPHPGDAAQLDRPVRGRARRLRDRGPGRAGHRLHDPTRHVVRRDVLRGRGRRTAGRRAGGRGAAGGVRAVPDRGPRAAPRSSG